MQLNLFTDIGLKSIMYLKNTEELVTINEIADQFSIPRNHLTKVLNLLVRLNWISSVRGRNGGLRYNKSTDDLFLGDVIAILENKPELLNCINCILSCDCSLRSILQQSLNAFYLNLNKYRIGDLNSEQTKTFLVKMVKRYK